MIEFKEVNEQARTYFYANGQKLRIDRVVKVGIAESGGHRLELSNGKKFIPRNDWLGIELEVAEWSF